ncbi:tRNA 4-thiouridine(8) synthase ThiI [Moraxella sp. FZLJ2107]|uniref:tRNA uracil 4-sulfurtransferase ThiI n=1 Tax=unclassified Moraxella TaxID=2685852 RepID=UPI0020C8C515|nr:MULTISPECIES: tRNA uracil 4-sulfurtransferase ThiI [unclassified Moraxella]UTO05874.1 tRNA 4-thiouridine(8) synthase ThiI [Moraxella sp. FZLJ2107]UTO22610.1 tRNA 4-thiouridine(8) synthase ThiI [Moraxella sp. FZLJ2109]
MKFIIKLFPEIIMKSETVRKRFVKVLTSNIKEILHRIDETVVVVRHWDFIEVRSNDESKRHALKDALARISGIHHYLEVDETPYTDLHDIFLQTLAEYQDKLIDKTFCVRVKRRGTQDFDSMQVMQYVGGGLNQHIESAKVKLKDPDVVVRIEIENDKMMLVKARHEGLGGYPMSTQEDVLSLISGGFDSSVSSFAFMRRGSRVHYCFFNLGGQAHEIGVKQMAYHLWSRYSSSHKVKFVTVDFETVVAEILRSIDDGQMGVVLKRMMVRAASQIAERMGIEAIVTGEALGQVASQTLTNLHMIDKAATRLVLRPLITHDKEQIVKITEQIGTFEIAKSMPEFCGVISKSPTVKAVESKIIATESEFDFGVLDTAIETAKVVDIRSLAVSDEIKLPDVVEMAVAGEVVIDIRSSDEIDELPLVLDEACQVLELPFYKLRSQFGALDQSKTYLLYCQQGVMSRLQAGQLMADGFDNVKVLKIKK